MELMEFSSDLMPHGKPNFISVINYPMIKALIETKGRKSMHKVVFLLVKDFCASMNVVRNMSEEQMIEAAGMLLDECDNFRLEDYVMMFQMAKRGELFDIHDRIDLQVITAMLDEYWRKRHEAGETHIENKINHIDTLGNTQRTSVVNMVWDDAKGYVEIPTISQQMESFSSAFSENKNKLETIIGNKEERERLRQIEKEDTESIRKQKQEKGYDD